MPDLPPEHYYASLATKRMGAGVLFTDQDDRVLLVEPTYKASSWEIPGGAVEAHESPYTAARRETAEELGLTRNPGALLVLDWVPQRGVRTEALMMLFDGGQLTDADIAAIVLPPTELRSFAFCDPEQAAQRLIPLLARRVAAALHARTHGVACLHDGVSVYPPTRRRTRMTTTSPVAADDAQALRSQLVDAVIHRIGLRDERVIAALRAVPRHLFAPAGTPLPAAYADDIVATKHHPDTGRVMSSLSAPWLVATMLEQLDVRPRVTALVAEHAGHARYIRLPRRRDIHRLLPLIATTGARPT